MGVQRITVESGNMGGQAYIRNLRIKFWDVYRDLAFHDERG